MNELVTNKDCKTINIGELAVATEVAACTQSCTDGDTPCCSRSASLDNFIFIVPKSR